MLRIFLYKNVILNRTYDNVFSLGLKDNKSILERYLETKEPLIITCEDAYYENTGRLIFDYQVHYSANIYDYNYMKIELYDKNYLGQDVLILTRYCFINSIEMKNAVVYVDYEEDIWSSYSDKIHAINESYLERSRVSNYDDFLITLKSLPKEYDGNNKLEIVKLSNHTKVQIILEIQEYVLNTQGQTTGRWSSFRQYAKNRTTLDSIEFQEGDQYFFYNDALEEIQKKILPAVSLSYLGFWNSTTGLVPGVTNFVIGNIYILPANFDIISNHSTQLNQGVKFIKHQTYGINGEIIDITGVLFNLGYEVSKDIFSASVANNYKNLGIGVLGNYIDIQNNGTSLTFTVSILIDNFSIHLYLNVLNQYIEITDDFIIQVPYSVITSEELAQQKVALQMKNLNYNYSKQKMQYKIVQGLADTAIGAFQMYSKEYGKGAQNEVGGMYNVFTGIEEQKRMTEENALVNSPIYSYNRGTFTNNSHMFNAKNGITLTRINSDNDDFVKKFINNFGYKVYEFVNTTKFNLLDLNGYTQFNTKGINYNVIKFNSIVLTGSFTKEIGEKLSSILTTGIKIWYSETMTEDNYVV